MIDLPYPNINGESEEKKIAQINNYLIQLKDSLEFALMSMESENMAMSESFAKGLNESNVTREDHMSQVSSKMTSDTDGTMSAIQQTEDRIMFAAFFIMTYLFLAVLGLPYCRAFLQLWPLSSCGTWASHGGGFSC